MLGNRRKCWENDTLSQGAGLKVQGTRQKTLNVLTVLYLYARR